MGRRINSKAALAHLRAADPVMGALIDRTGKFAMRPGAAEPFRSLSRAIVYQQLSGKAAGTIFGRFVAMFGDGDGLAPEQRRTDPDWSPLTAPFPSPAEVLGKTDEELRAVGLSRQKAASIRSLAEHFASGELSVEHFSKWDDEAIIDHLTRVRGIGRWTAEMFLMFDLRRPDVLPVNDVGINRAIMKLYKLEALPKAPDVLRIGEPWRPWATVACWYLWRSEDTQLPVG